ncbi:hypothetical protein ACFPOA_15850 [Lysobacter niabensis]|uniref:hypothetical protein n=1 Tax=Agrilutibacter niabensis TaxID=380628 RepID=UPI0036135268
MKAVLFYLKQILLLGTAGFAVFVLVAWWHIGPFLASDTPQAWLFALALVATFLVTVATPVQLACRFFRAPRAALVAGFLSGPLAVVIAFLLFTRYPLTFNSYVSRALFPHVLFSLIGLCFAFNFQRWLGPNNSFKPKPLRGSA